jgi:hypothetical protein
MRTMGSDGGSTIEGRLRFIANASALLSLGLFVYVVRYRLQLADFFPTVLSMLSRERWLAFLSGKGGPVVLAGTALYWLLAWRREYTWQLSTARSLYPQSRVPRDLSTAVGASLWLAMAVVFNATFLALVWFVDNLPIFAAGILVISVVAVVSEWMTRTNLRKTFSDRRYSPLPNDKRRLFISRRREVIEHYYFMRPHAVRHALCVGLSCLALVTAIADASGAKMLPVGIAYTAIALAVFGNDALVLRWRAIRNRRLAAIDDEEEMADAESHRKAPGP